MLRHVISPTPEFPGGELSSFHPHLRAVSPMKETGICGWTRHFTHVCLWIDTSFHPHPTRHFTHTPSLQSLVLQGFSARFLTRNARARFLTYRIFNASGTAHPVDNSTRPVPCPKNNRTASWGLRPRRLAAFGRPAPYGRSLPASPGRLRLPNRRPLRGHRTAWRAAARLKLRGAAPPLSSAAFGRSATSTPLGHPYGVPPPPLTRRRLPLPLWSTRRRKGQPGSSGYSQHPQSRHIEERQGRAKGHRCGAASAARRGFHAVAGRVVAGRSARRLCGLLEACMAFPLLVVFIIRRWKRAGQRWMKCGQAGGQRVGGGFWPSIRCPRPVHTVPRSGIVHGRA